MQEESDDHDLQQAALISGNLDHHLALAGCDFYTGENAGFGLTQMRISWE